jgi:diguanylate cyclase (GGDEF)-like protein/PAS domain S-box-containing protein
VTGTTEDEERYRRLAALANSDSDAISERLEATLNSQLDPQVFLETIRDPAGQIVDFFYLDANAAACAYMGLSRSELIGSRLITHFPTEFSSELLARCATLVETGEPMVIDDTPLSTGVGSAGRRFDMRGVRVGDGAAFMWRDVTDRHVTLAQLAESERRYRLLAENASDVVFQATVDGVIEWISASVSSSTDWDPDVLVGTPFISLIHPEDRETYRFIHSTPADGDPSRFEVRIRTAAGAYRWISVFVRPLLDENGTLIGRIGGWSDIESDVRARVETAEHAELMRVVLDNARDPIMRFDLDLRLEYVNHAVTELSGIPAENLLGRTIVELGYSEADVAELHAEARRVIETGVAITLETELDNLLGHRVYEANVSPIFAPEGSVTNVIATCRDITDRHLAEEMLLERATHDALTGLANRAGLNDEIRRALAATRRSNSHTAVLMIDLDRFKNVNDTLGHGVGDDLLRAAAARLSSHVRDNDLIARVGGDEFVVVLRELDDPADAVRTAERIVQHFRDPFLVEGNEIYATATVGVAIDAGRIGADEILRQADTALYAAKDNGRDQVSLFNQNLRAAVAERLTLESELRLALGRDEFEVWYQPEVDLHTGGTTAVEALLHWHHPSGETHTSEKFIEIAEETGLIFAIGEWVIAQACRQASEWATVAPITSLVMTVNLRPIQLGEPGLPAIVETALRTSGLDPSQLCIGVGGVISEIDRSATQENLDRLGDMGIRLSVDGIGTGHGALNRVRRFPVHALEISEPFVSDIATDPDTRKILTDIIELAHDLGMLVTAIGVASTAQADILRELGCDRSRGSLHSPAIAPREMERFLRIVPTGE